MPAKNLLSLASSIMNATMWDTVSGHIGHGLIGLLSVLLKVQMEMDTPPHSLSLSSMIGVSVIKSTYTHTHKAEIDIIHRGEVDLTL